MALGACHIGTSGWSYAHWAKGTFYPQGLKPTDWLKHYAGHFATVELNASFYRPPKPQMIDRWRLTVGPRFLFAVKLWRRITHDRKLVHCDAELRDFLNLTAAFRAKRGPLLIQLPPSLHRDDQRLEAFLDLFKTTLGRKRWLAAVEFRHSSWLADPVYRLLDRHNIACVLADLARCPIVEPNDVPFIYIRRHGPGGPYRGCYSHEHLAADADRIRRWLAAGKNVYVYFNNDLQGHAVNNARQLIDMIGR